MIGTRPEVIKLNSIHLEMKNKQGIEPIICSTNQQKGMLQETLNHFHMNPDLEIRETNYSKNLNSKTARIIKGVDKILLEDNYHGIIVQGDTTTAASSSLAAFNNQVPIFHIEAGLRSFNLQAPFPEEGNRKIISSIASIHFAPTAKAAENLVNEGVRRSQIIVTGNTGIDAFLRNKELINKQLKNMNELKSHLLGGKNQLILLTCHRRESFGENMVQIFEAILEITKIKPDIQIIFPVHPNPGVKNLAKKFFKNNKSITLLPPQKYANFVSLMLISDLIISDSGGIQEEVCYIQAPLLVIRGVTERSEVLQLEGIELVNFDKKKITEKSIQLIGQKFPDRAKKQVFGNGKAYEIIVNEVLKYESK
jgi:UDP-N-acetylglucosamine 2-epimerase (non-hydrolysing)